MSTAELEINAWRQTENTVDVVEAWELEVEEILEQVERPEPEPQPGLPEDFWQEWFGLWR